MTKKDFLKALSVTAEIYDKKFSEDAANCYLMDLEGNSWSDLIKALSRCRKELRNFPSVSDIESRIESGHPGVEVAWALIPKAETDTVVWTEEIAEAFAACSSLIEEDPIAARMAFKESYTRILQVSRNERRPVRWIHSLGTDKPQRDAKLHEAVRLGRMTEDEARLLLPDTSFAISRQAPALGGPTPISALLTGPKELEEKAGL